MEVRVMRLEAPAKINLWLRVLARRPDGFHELQSELALLDLADTLVLDRGPGRLVLESGADDLAVDATNLAWQGMAAGFGRWPAGWRLTLSKAIPLAAGLGGGSSDAAAAWRLARCLLSGEDPRPSPKELAQLAHIGADVPFFAAATPMAVVGGIGELVYPQPAPAADPIVLIHPPFPLSTAAVFAATAPADWSGPAAPSDESRNDLLPAALRLAPGLADVLAAVRRAGSEGRLSGSGPTLWVRESDPERARALVDRLGAANLRTTLTRLRTEPASIDTMHTHVSGLGTP
jgi:4-diphosphocytidyl-2-C-methyl-D-erythritol kinase